MKIQENDLIIDKIISKYNTLSKKEKTIINLSLVVLLSILILGKVYEGGEVFGKFIYNISH